MGTLRQEAAQLEAEIRLCQTTIDRLNEDPDGPYITHNSDAAKLWDIRRDKAISTWEMLTGRPW